MRTQRVVSRSATYQKFEVLKTNRNKRHRYNQFFVEGVRNINAAIEYGWHVVSLLYVNRFRLSNWATDILSTTETDVNYELSPELMSELSNKGNTSEVLAIVEMRDDDPSKIPFSRNPVLALFDRPSKKGNLGTTIRSCDALGVEGLIITGHAVDLYDPEVIGSSMGSFFSVPVVRIADNDAVMAFIRQMKSTYAGFKTVGTTAHAESKIDDVDMTVPTMFMIGSEADGLSRTFRETCDLLVTIPMNENASASSINVGCAATVMFYEASRQRR